MIMKTIVFNSVPFTRIYRLSVLEIILKCEINPAEQEFAARGPLTFVGHGSFEVPCSRVSIFPQR